MMPRPLTAAENMEIHRLHQEIEALGERFDEERLEWRAQLSRLRLEAEALRRLLAERDPMFDSEFRDSFEELRHTFDPEKKPA